VLTLCRLNLANAVSLRVFREIAADGLQAVGKTRDEMIGRAEAKPKRASRKGDVWRRSPVALCQGSDPAPLSNQGPADQQIDLHGHGVELGHGPFRHMRAESAAKENRQNQ
jgi:hypothetical protein